MAPRKKDKAKSEARKHKRAGKDVLREIHRMCPEARIAGQGLTLDGTEIRIASPKLISLPESIGTLDALRRLDLSACISLASLPDAIGKLRALTGLYLNDCPSLVALPESIGWLRKLTYFDLAGCLSLSSLPSTIGGLTALETLNLEKCKSISILPNGIGELWRLEALNLSECTRLALSERIGGLVGLGRIDLCGSKLASLPDAIGELGVLHTLELSECGELATLPDTIGGLACLEVLNLFDCSSLIALPNSMGELRVLRRLNLSFCLGLAALPDAIGAIYSLSELHVTGCTRLAALPEPILAMPGLHLLGWSRARNAASTLEEFQASLQCPLSTDILREPMRALPCGHVYSKVSAFSYFKGAGKKCVVYGCDKHLKCSNFVEDEACEEAMRSFINFDGRLDIRGADRGNSIEGIEASRLRRVLEIADMTGDELPDDVMLVRRRLRRRVCDACGRQGTLKEERFPVCWCGARRYCNEACQLVDWDRGHSVTCASGHTFPQERLDALRALPVLRDCLKMAPKEKHDGRSVLGLMFSEYPPPADRPR